MFDTLGEVGQYIRVDTNTPHATMITLFHAVKFHFTQVQVWNQRRLDSSTCPEIVQEQLRATLTEEWAEAQALEVLRKFNKKNPRWNLESELHNVEMLKGHGGVIYFQLTPVEGTDEVSILFFPHGKYGAFLKEEPASQRRDHGRSVKEEVMKVAGLIAA